MVLLVFLLQALVMVTMMTVNTVGSVPSPPSPLPCGGEASNTFKLGFTLKWSPSATVTTARRLSSSTLVTNVTGFEAAVVAELANLTSVSWIDPSME